MSIGESDDELRPEYDFSILKGKAIGKYTKRYKGSRTTYIPKTALAQSVKFADDMMQVFLTDGRIICVPIIWFPILHESSPAQRKHYEIGGGGISLHWPDLDEDLSVASLLAGVDWDSA